MDHKVKNGPKGEQLVKTLLRLAATIAIFLAAGIMPADAATLDVRPFDSRAISSAEFGGAGAIGVSHGFRGSAADGKADATLATVDTEEEYAALLRRKSKTATGSLELGDAETVIGSDRRARFYTTTFPNRAVGLITFDQGGSSFICTGWLISPDTVATAGHCIHSGGPGGVFSTNLVFIPGKDGASNPFGSCNGTTLFFDQTWVNTANEAFDFGAIRLNCTIGNTVGWFGFWSQHGTLNKQHALISGYPGDLGGITQWGAFGAIKTTQAKQIFYFNDTFGGMSGSPIYQPDRPGPVCFGVCAMGIHAYGIPHGTGPHLTQNHGTRINSHIFNGLISAIDAP
jgi:glutamyl endopeptidase